ncbi:helix-turn-helix transcriptional regulator [Lujinxingia vulgaris]|uniref:Helix-turn-helix transcriptional regulator n=1 Tax=Lujinxingia vulgaris TaxID=2600176 RepID=A0A5C6XJA1_9DELT|nr:metalloregulator ArsR/SmtB family transcription factor [Lujinxingia vulgaris]TXD37332.1 helix-turn-helix transcriptional regulator [Lujinxingia vulgaris]
MNTIDLSAAMPLQTFRALAEPTRIELLAMLMRAGGQANVGTLTDAMSVDGSVVSRHLRELHRAGLLDVERRGRERWYSINYDAFISQFSDLVRQFEALRDGKPCCK